jgi:hypothetical protein
MKRFAVLLFFHLAGLALAAQPSPPSRAWPHPIPCRIQDGSNPDLFVMTLGDVETPIAQGVFDPIKDEVTLKDGTVTSHYYRDVRGIKFYEPLDKSRFPLPPSGMCTWYYYYTRVNEDEVRWNAEWMAAHLKDYGAQYVQIDDGWQGTGARGSARNWEAINTQRFSKGMARLAKDIKALGLTPGIWLAPHGQNNDDVVKTNAGVFLLRPDGSTASDTWEGRFLVDPTYPGSHTYLSNLFARLAGWGYEYFKIDGQPIVVNEYDSKKQFMKHPATTDDGAVLYRKTLETIRSAIGPNRYLLGCWGTPIEGAGIMNGSRTGGDIVLGWGGFQVALRPTLQYFYLHNIVWYSDPDVLIVRSPLTLDQARVWATLQGLTGQALMSSDRLMDLGEERIELLRRVYPAVDIRPLDLFPTERYKRIWDLKVNHLGRQYDVVGVFNFGTDRKEQTHLKWKDLGLPANELVHVFDFWNKEYLGAWAEGMIVETAPTSCRVLTLLPSNHRIQLISTSRHMTQGWVDLAELKVNSAGDTFAGKSKVVKNDPYQLSFAFPRGTNYLVKRVAARGRSGKLPVKISNHQGWSAVELTSPQTGEVNWEVQFGPGEYYHYPPSAPEGTIAAQRVGLDGINLSWREQYYLNVGYQVYLDGSLQGYTPVANFPLRGLDPRSNYTAQVKTIAEDGRESPRPTEVKFSLRSMVPSQMLLTQLEPVRSTGRWRGIELEEMLTGAPLAVGDQHFEHGLSSFANSEVEYNLAGLYERFTVQVGVDNSSGGTNATAEFFILGDGRELWRSGGMTKSNAPIAADVSISGVHRLLLRTEGNAGGQRGRNRAQADWGEPKISRSNSAQ